MVLAEYFGTTRNFTIFATDLSTQALRTAHRAVYPNDLGASIPFGLRQKYTLTGHGSQTGKFRIVPELRGRVTFDQRQPDRARLADTGNHEYGLLPQYDDLLRPEDAG